jgi:phage gpG-like protein
MKLNYHVKFRDAVNTLEKFGNQAPSKATEALDEYGEESVTSIKKRVTQIGLVQSGTLRARTTYVRTSNKAAQVRVRVHYAAIHEFGGTIKPKPGTWTITPKNGKFLKFEVNGKTVFARKVVQQRKLVFEINGKKVFAKSVTIKEKRYVRDSMDELVKKAVFEEIVADKILEGIQ